VLKVVDKGQDAGGAAKADAAKADDPEPDTWFKA
jgi:hypothetical protein